MAHLNMSCLKGPNAKWQVWKGLCWFYVVNSATFYEQMLLLNQSVGVGARFLFIAQMVTISIITRQFMASFPRMNRLCTVGSDEKFQIPGQEIIFEISGTGPSYLSIGTSQDHIWSYFEHMCWSAQVECGGV